AVGGRPDAVVAGRDADLQRPRADVGLAHDRPGVDDGDDEVRARAAGVDLLLALQVEHQVVLVARLARALGALGLARGGRRRWGRRAHGQRTESREQRVGDRGGTGRGLGVGGLLGAAGAGTGPGDHGHHHQHGDEQAHAPPPVDVASDSRVSAHGFRIHAARMGNGSMTYGHDTPDLAKSSYAGPRGRAETPTPSHSGVVRKQRPGSPVAHPRPDAVGSAGQRDHAAADAGVAGAARLARVDGPLAHPEGAGRGALRRGGARVGAARLPAACACTPAPPASPSGTAARPRPTTRRSSPCRASASTRPPPSPASRTGDGTPSWTRTYGGCWHGRYEPRSTPRRPPRPPNAAWPKPSCPNWTRPAGEWR